MVMNQNSTIGRYVLDSHDKPVACSDIHQWNEFMSTNNYPNRVVAKTVIRHDPNISVVTLFSGQDYGFHLEPHEHCTAILWETKIIGGKLDNTQERYWNINEAISGHLRLVDEAKK